jgi:transposase
MAYIQGEGRNQGTLFPVVLDDFVPADHMCRVIDAFVEKLVMSDLGFERARAAETGRPGYDPRDLLKLYLYGYLNQIRSSRRLEAECRRNVELIWLLRRLYPDHKSIAYNVQTAVDTEHALIVAHAVVLDASDIRCLQPMAEAAKRALETNSFKVVADAGYSNGEQPAYCEAAGMVPYVPVMRSEQSGRWHSFRSYRFPF